jgi:hypothetical protein
MEHPMMKIVIQAVKAHHVMITAARLFVAIRTLMNLQESSVTMATPQTPMLV